jgi:hypothetical protein
LIVRGYEGMKARETYIVQVDRYHLAEAAQRVIALYEVWGRPEQVKSWKQWLGLVELPGEVFAQP